MRLTRREFLEISGSAAAVLGLGLAAVIPEHKGQLAFEDFRALPGMLLNLHLDMDHPEQATVSIVIRSEGREAVIETMQGASDLKIEMPTLETTQESFELYAVADCGFSRSKSPSVEVLSQPYLFGL